MRTNQNPNQGYWDCVFRHVVFACGFRIFFLTASGYATLSILTWAGFWFGLVPLPDNLSPAEWHAHEMIFGFALAALCGFLLTATPEWTDTPPRTGRYLGLLLGLWVLGRLAMIMAGVLPIWIVVGINALVLPLLAFWTLPALWGERRKRHRSLIAFILGLGLAQIAVYSGWILDAYWPDLGGHHVTLENLGIRGLHASLHMFLAAVSLVVTRISMVLVPNALDEQDDRVSHFRPLPPRRNLALATIVIFAVADFIAPQSPVTGWIALAAAAAQLDRLADWHVGKVLLKSYVLMLYLTHVWMAVGFAGLGLDLLLSWDGFSASRHALSLGSASLAILSVFIVAGLRHTGREVVLSPLLVAALVLINLATVTRVFLPVLAPNHFVSIGVGVASTLWALAFLCHFIAFWPILTSPRADDKPG